MTDYISRADAIDAVARLCTDGQTAKVDGYFIPIRDALENVLSALPSADAVPTVIRAKTFMQKEDFDKWAEDIKRQGENVVCIPCDAEVVSANRPSGEWEYLANEPYSRCSVCGAYIDDLDDDKYTYCPYCGARMKGGDDE